MSLTPRERMIDRAVRAAIEDTYGPRKESGVRWMRCQVGSRDEEFRRGFLFVVAGICMSAIARRWMEPRRDAKGRFTTREKAA